ncbi:biotin/lipoyl-containing protein [Ruania zhangjianzhongii]|uniref:biotin/lipoyl-containing protein n=1 Tax=Ruania zhangjianzhongii TaxID=2603206 RepID=UPI0011C9337E|nr:biotin/lipoyl-containing protein [Ruania zhangjianzhongii]
MAEVRFPQMSDGDEGTGVVATWYVASGDEVTTSTLIAEVAVDKVDAEVYPPQSGVITLQVAEGVEVAQGSLIATIE